MLAFELKSLDHTFGLVFGGSPPEFLSKILNQLEAFIPPSLEVALVLAFSDTSVSDQVPDLIQGIPALAALPETFDFPAGLTVVAVIQPGSSCAETDLLCHFISEHLGTQASLIAAASVTFDPSIAFKVSLGNIMIQKHPQCSSESGAARTRLDTASMFIEGSVGADGAAFEAGLEVLIGFETGKRPAGNCVEGFVRPLHIGGRVYVVLEAGGYQLGGALSLVGVWYQSFGLDFLHLADLMVDVAFTPPAPLPTAFEASGTVAIGRKCYAIGDGGEVVPGGANDPCLRVTTEMGYDATDPSANYFSMSIDAITIGEAVRIFAPDSVAQDVLAVVPAEILNSGISGFEPGTPAEFSFTANPGGAKSSKKKRRLPGGLRLSGRAALLPGLLPQDFAIEIISLPPLKMYIHAIMPPLRLPGLSMLKITTGYPTGCSPKDPNVDSKLYAKARKHCGAFKSRDACLKEAAVGEPLCVYHDQATEGPELLVDLGLGGDLSTVAPELMASLSSGTVDMASLGNMINCNARISGRMDFLMGSSKVVLEVNKRNFLLSASFVGVFGIPALYANLDINAAYGSLNQLAFGGRAELGLKNVLGEIARKAVEGLQHLVALVQPLFKEDGVLHDIIGLLDGVDDALKLLEDVPMGGCLAPIGRSAMSLINSLVDSLDMKDDNGVKIATLKALLEYVVKKINRLLTMFLEFDPSGGIEAVEKLGEAVLPEASAVMDMSTGPSGSSFAFQVKARWPLVGASEFKTFGVKLKTDVGTGVIEDVGTRVIKDLKTAFVKEMIPMAAKLQKGFNDMTKWVDETLEEAKRLAQFECDPDCQKTMKMLWKNILAGPANTAIEVVQHAAVIITGPLDAIAWVMEQLTSLLDSFRGMLDSVSLKAPSMAECQNRCKCSGCPDCTADCDQCISACRDPEEDPGAVERLVADLLKNAGVEESALPPGWSRIPVVSQLVDGYFNMVNGIKKELDGFIEEVAAAEEEVLGLKQGIDDTLSNLRFPDLEDVEVSFDITQGFTLGIKLEGMDRKSLKVEWGRRRGARSATGHKTRRSATESTAAEGLDIELKTCSCELCGTDATYTIEFDGGGGGKFNLNLASDDRESGSTDFHPRVGYGAAPVRYNTHPPRYITLESYGSNKDDAWCLLELRVNNETVKAEYPIWIDRPCNPDHDYEKFGNPKSVCVNGKFTFEFGEDALYDAEKYRTVTGECEDVCACEPCVANCPDPEAPSFAKCTEKFDLCSRLFHSCDAACERCVNPPATTAMPTTTIFEAEAAPAWYATAPRVETCEEQCKCPEKHSCKECDSDSIFCKVARGACLASFAALKAACEDAADACMEECAARTATTTAEAFAPEDIGQACADAAEDLFDLIVEELASFYVDIKEGAVDAFMKAQEGFISGIETFVRVLKAVASGDLLRTRHCYCPDRDGIGYKYTVGTCTALALREHAPVCDPEPSGYSCLGELCSPDDLNVAMIECDPEPSGYSCVHEACVALGGEHVLKCASEPDGCKCAGRECFCWPIGHKRRRCWCNPGYDDLGGICYNEGPLTKTRHCGCPKDRAFEEVAGLCYPKWKSRDCGCKNDDYEDLEFWCVQIKADFHTDAVCQSEPTGYTCADNEVFEQFCVLDVNAVDKSLEPSRRKIRRARRDLYRARRSLQLHARY